MEQISLHASLLLLVPLQAILPFGILVPPVVPETLSIHRESNQLRAIVSPEMCRSGLSPWPPVHPPGLTAFVFLALKHPNVIDGLYSPIIESKTFMMEYPIDAIILRQATACESGFKCASPHPDFPRCPVDNPTGLMFVKTAPLSLCPYKRSFGSSFYCRCPARKEIYSKYGA